MQPINTVSETALGLRSGSLLADEPGHRLSIQARESGQLEGVHPPLAVLTLRDEGLVLSERPGDLHLSHVRCTASLNEPLAEQQAAGVFLSHVMSMRYWDIYPNSGYSGADLRNKANSPRSPFG